MRRLATGIASLALLTASCTAPSGPVGKVALSTGNPILTMSEAERRRVQLAGPQMLFWNEAQRSMRFREMEKHLPGTVAAPARRPRPLPPGASLAGLNDAEIDAAMEAGKLAGLMVVQDGRVRLERYRMDFGPAQRWTSFSVAKSLTSTLAGQALKEGYISALSDPVTRYLPELNGSAYDGVSIEQVLTMSSGVRWSENYADPASDVARMFSEPLVPGVDPALSYLAKLPREAEPGQRWVYKTGETNLIGTIVQRATGRVLTEYAATRLVDAAGFEGELFWMIDPVGNNIGGCCLSLSMRDYARIGLLALEGGRGVVAKDWFARASRPAYQSNSPGVGYGYQWWTLPGGRWGAQGIFGQTVTVLPAQRAVIVQLGNWPVANSPELWSTRAGLADRIVRTLD